MIVDVDFCSTAFPILPSPSVCCLVPFCFLPSQLPPSLLQSHSSPSHYSSLTRYAHYLAAIYTPILTLSPSFPACLLGLFPFLPSYEGPSILVALVPLSCLSLLTSHPFPSSLTHSFVPMFHRRVLYCLNSVTVYKFRLL